MTESQRKLLYRTIFFAVLLLAVYWNTLSNRFVWDDLDVIVKNRLLEHLGNLPKLFFFEDRTGDGFTGYYRPMTYITFLVDRAIWGTNPFGFNLTNLLLHIATTLLFFEVVLTLFKRERLAWAATLIFALHPIANESVNFHAGGRNTLLCACFALLSLLCYLKGRRAAALVSFAVAIFSKEFALLLPGIFLLYDWSRRAEKPNWRSYLPYVLTIFGYLTLRSFAVHKANLFQTLQLSGNLLNIPQLVLSYLKNMLFPFRLKVIYDLQPSNDLAALALFWALLAAVVCAVWLFRKRSELVAAACWFFLFLLPVIGILPLGSMTIADRYAYFSLMGFSLALGYLLCEINQRVTVALLVVIALGFAVVDVQRTAIWNNLLSLYMQMTKDAPNRSIGFTNVGMYYYERGDLAQAERYLEESCNKKGIVIRDALQYLSATYWEGQKYDKALAVLDRMIALEPGNPQPYIMASKIYQSKGDAANAKIYHDKVVALFPNIEEMMQGRVMSLCQEGEKLMGERKSAEAERKFKEALMMNPEFVPALIDMGGVVAERGDHAAALVQFKKAEALEPGNPSIHYNLSMVYDLMGKKEEAAGAMQRFQELEAKAPQQVKAPGGRK